MRTGTDRGGRTFATWRFGSAYGAAFLSNTWYPDRRDPVRLALTQGTLILGFDAASNLGAEFWPDFRARIFHRRRLGNSVRTLSGLSKVPGGKP